MARNSFDRIAARKPLYIWGSSFEPVGLESSGSGHFHIRTESVDDHFRAPFDRIRSLGNDAIKEII